MSSKQALAAALLLTPALVAWAAPGAAHAGGGPLVDVAAGALSPQLCGGQGCWTNHLRVTDIDGDADLDAIFVNYGDFFGGSNSPEPLAIYENDGAGGFTNVSASAVAGLQTNAHQICAGDVDGDGARDLYIPDGTGTAHRLMMNDGAGVFVDEADARLPAETPSSGACRFGDLDGDGDLDLVVADGYGGGAAALLLYENDGAGVFTEVVGAFSGAISGQEIDDIEILDVDRDFDLDVFANAHEGGFGGYYLNDGTGAMTGQTFPAPQPGGSGYHYNAAPCDVDGDGDLDLWIDNIGGNFTEQLSINDGAGVFTDVTAAQVSGNASADDNGVACVDIDNDGDFDGVVLSLGTAERLLENDGAGTFVFASGAFPSGTDSTLWGEFGDLDGDGRLDLVTGQGEFGDQTNKVYLGNAMQPVDDRAPTIIAVQDDPWTEGTDPVVRFAVSDRAMSDEGPRLARAFITIDPDGANTDVAATFVGGDVFYAALPTVPAEGYDYQACAEDPAGNIGCSPPVSILGGGSDTGNATGDTGVADSGGSEVPDGTADDTGTAPDTGVQPPDGGPGGNMTDSMGTGDGTGDGGAADGDGGGCSCRADGSGDGAPRAAWLLMLLALPLARRRRR